MNQIEIDNLVDNVCQNGASTDEIIRIVRSHKIGEFKLSEYSKSDSLTGLMILVMKTGKYKHILSVIEEYLKKYPEEINLKCTKGWTALMIAARNSNGDSSTETVKLLLEYGANTNALDCGGGWTALMMAATNSNRDSNIETVRLLLDYGANINAFGPDGWTALMMAARNSNDSSTIETVRMLLDCGANINTSECDGLTALMMAAGNSNFDSNIETVKLLLDYGADPDIIDKNGDVALLKAIKVIDSDSNEATVKLLLEYNPNMNIIDDDGNSVFMRIIQMPHVNISLIHSILHCKPNICLVNKDGKTIMGLTDNLNIRKILIEYAYDQYIDELISDHTEEITKLKHRVKFLEDTIELHPDNEEIKKLSGSFYQKAGL